MNYEFNYNLYRENRKTISIKVDIDSKVIVKAPVFERIEKINEFISGKNLWILKQIEKANEQSRNRYVFESMQQIMIFGKRYKIFVNPKAKTPMLFNNIFSIPNYNIEYINDFIRETTMHYILDRLQHFAKLLCVTYNNVLLTNAKSRWGSCSSQRNLCFNYKLCMLEPYMIDYIIIHELCHLKHLNHSQLFWHEVAKYYPDYQNIKKQMNSYAFITHLYA